MLEDHHHPHINKRTSRRDNHRISKISSMDTAVEVEKEEEIVLVEAEDSTVMHMERH